MQLPHVPLQMHSQIWGDLVVKYNKVHWCRLDSHGKNQIHLVASSIGLNLDPFTCDSFLNWSQLDSFRLNKALPRLLWSLVRYQTEGLWSCTRCKSPPPAATFQPSDSGNVPVIWWVLRQKVFDRNQIEAPNHNTVIDGSFSTAVRNLIKDHQISKHASSSESGPIAEWHKQQWCICDILSIYLFPGCSFICWQVGVWIPLVCITDALKLLLTDFPDHTVCSCGSFFLAALLSLLD